MVYEYSKVRGVNFWSQPMGWPDPIRNDLRENRSDMGQ